MFLRIDRLQVEMPLPKDPDPWAAAAVNGLMGGRFGEMTALNTYMYQSFNFRQREKLRPLYTLIANIATKGSGPYRARGRGGERASARGRAEGRSGKGQRDLRGSVRRRGGRGAEFPHQWPAWGDGNQCPGPALAGGLYLQLGQPVSRPPANVFL
ncbi:manganese catalase family protein [Rhodobacteraceae bacterium PA1-206B]